ncbi:SDR family NAD(P)-dependent oxidoreductase [Robertkochia marina]|uniref:SDR family NAD(P)-dependent oxidoreductase n=1 Tax=Robertkochia marina TaxID=1227945 RepID=A0A4S3M4E8_9FLAO|nr:sugar nucleotide-binding protein [Robertkochia marina]THD69685.1 SDR family NAD(P)-dependent oxidoreductase [Robertkochia marina]TRZ46969.1 SDR family NAD(P)-dependent oxidoreductase [Robertkochia marina]
MTNSTKKQISILGCGWLGMPLSKTLLGHGFSIKGSTTTAEKTPLLKQQGISPYHILIKEDRMEGSLKEFVEGSNILIVDIPPGLRSNPSSNFPARVKTLLEGLANTKIQHILFISSTSVFPDLNTIFSEEDTPEPDSNSGKQLLEAERLILNDSRKNSVLRFGGLIGPDRHPINFLSGKKDLSGGSKPINLIHLDDCIGLIIQVVTENIWSNILHGVTPFHPSKSEYYVKEAQKRELPPPGFKNEADPKGGKIISGKKTMQLLSYTYQHPELSTMD